MSTTKSTNNKQNKSPMKRKEQKLLQKEEKKLAKQQKRKGKMKESSQKKSQRQEHKQTKTPKRRLIPVWVKVLIVIILASSAMLVGLMVGYGTLGDGNPTEVFEIKTWKHIIDIVLG